MDVDARKRLPLFPIGIVQRLTGLSARQIRYYEQHELVHPARSEGNQRLFSFVDVERLLEVRTLLDEGLNMAGVKARLAKRQNRRRSDSAELTDEQVYQHIRQGLLEPRTPSGVSEFQGDLFRFYRKH
ncbi:MAG: MerR family transcriptional regulator [Alicyclobacillus sp.]|nr:MerR family transcriptional regulator [Alicyclobacillus sp.]